MHRLVGADRNQSLDMRKELIVAGREGLLDQLDAYRCCYGKKRFRFMRLPGLVGVGDEARLRNGVAHRHKSRLIAVAAKLQLEQGVAARLSCLSGHHFGWGKRNGEGRFDYMEREESCKLGGAPP